MHDIDCMNIITFNSMKILFFFPHHIFIDFTYIMVIVHFFFFKFNIYIYIYIVWYHIDIFNESTYFGTDTYSYFSLQTFNTDEFGNR